MDTVAVERPFGQVFLSVRPSERELNKCNRTCRKCTKFIRPPRRIKEPKLAEFSSSAVSLSPRINAGFRTLGTARKELMRGQMGCRTGNGEKLRSSQAKPGQAIKSAVA